MTARRGLSLFELLVALALMAVMAAALAANMHLGVTLFERARVENTELSDALARRVRLRAWLARALPPSRPVAFPATAFSGTSDRFTFTTLAPTRFAPDAAALVVAVSRGASGTLTLSAEAVDDDGTAIAQVGGPLASGLGSVEFRYYDLQSTPPGWRADWTAEPGHLPALVSITARGPGGAPSRDWPDFTVRLVYGAPIAGL